MTVSFYPINQGFATYEDIFVNFVSPKVKDLMGYEKDQKIYLFHKPHSIYDKNRFPTVKELRDGLTFYIATYDDIKAYKEARQVVLDTSNFKSDKVINHITYVKTALTTQAKKYQDEKKNNWITRYIDHINNSNFIVNNNSTESYNSKSVVLGFRKFNDATVQTRAIIPDFQAALTSEKSELINVFDIHIFQENLDSVFMPITLNGVDVINFSQEYTDDNSLVRLCDIAEIGILKWHLYQFNSGGTYTPIENTITIEYDKFIDYDKLSAIINDDTASLEYSDVEGLNNFTVESTYTKGGENLSYALIETSVTTRQEFKPNTRVTLSDDKLSSATLKVDTLQSGFTYTPFTAVSINPQKSQLAVRPESAPSDGAATSPNIQPIVSEPKQVTLNTTASMVNATVPVSIKNTAELLSKPIVSFDSANFSKYETVICKNNPIMLDKLKYSDTVEMMQAAGAYIIPCNITNSNGEVVIKPHEPLTNNAIIMPDKNTYFIPSFNGYNLNPGKRAAVFTFMQDRTKAEHQLMIEQWGPSVIIKLTFDKSFSKDNIKLYYKSANTKNLNFYYKSTDTEDTKNNKELFKIINEPGFNDEKNPNTITYEIKYNSYNLNIPSELRYITFEIEDNSLSGKCTIDIEYNGITSYKGQQERTIVDTKNKLYQNWVDNKSYVGNFSQDMKDFIGIAPTIWEQNNVYIIIYKK